MTITRKKIDEMRTHGRLRIDADLEEMILAEYGIEPEPYGYTEQDLHEQIRKLVYQYNRDHPDPRHTDRLTPWKREHGTSDSIHDLMEENNRNS
jgi:hypothetical protein